MLSGAPCRTALTITSSSSFDPATASWISTSCLTTIFTVLRTVPSYLPCLAATQLAASRLVDLPSMVHSVPSAVSRSSNPFLSSSRFTKLCPRLRFPMSPKEACSVELDVRLDLDFASSPTGVFAAGWSPHRRSATHSLCQEWNRKRMPVLLFAFKWNGFSLPASTSL